jgi:hypothetical protein
MSNVRLYGNDHSPWVQAVMLGLHQKKMAYTRTARPPLEVFKQWGPMMPAASFDGAPWQLESKDILHKLGYSACSDEDMRAIRRAWRGVMHRADYWPRFWGEFSLASDPHPSPVPRFVNNFLRAFTILYFFTLIRHGVFANRGYHDPANHGDQFLEWEERFSAMDGPFLAGDEPDVVDLLLFGIIQCHCSIPVPPLYALQSDPRLDRTREWIANMQRHFADYPSLYSNVYFAPHALGPKPASGMEQFAFWLGAIVAVAGLPMTLPVSAYFIYRNRRLRGR